MNRENQHSRNDGAARVRASFRSTWLGWTDPHTGDRLTVRMNGDTDYISELVSEGFELVAALDADGAGDFEGHGDAQRSGACEGDEPPTIRRFASVAVEARGELPDGVHGPNGASALRRSGNRRAG